MDTNCLLLLQENLEQQKFENVELISYIQTLEKDLSCLTSSTVAKERETIRKDLEKAKTKLKETESKLKIAIQEKTKIEVVFLPHPMISWFHRKLFTFQIYALTY